MGLIYGNSCFIHVILHTILYGMSFDFLGTADVKLVKILRISFCLNYHTLLKTCATVLPNHRLLPNMSDVGNCELSFHNKGEDNSYI